MKTANVKNSNTGNAPESHQNTDTNQKQSLEALLNENEDYYDNLRDLVGYIKKFENKSYKNFKQFAEGFEQSLESYIQRTPLKDDEKFTQGYLKAIDSLIKNDSVDNEKKKGYVQKVIDQISPMLLLEYQKINKTLSPDDYHNMVKGAMNDPMIMFNPFASNLTQELSKNEGFDRSIKLSNLLKDMEKDLSTSNYSNLGGYFEKIPYNKEAYKKTGLKDEDINKMMKEADDTFKDVVKDLDDNSKKEITTVLIGVLSTENDKQLSSLDKTHSMNSFNAANPGLINGLYLALNSRNYANGNPMARASMPSNNLYQPGIGI